MFKKPAAPPPPPTPSTTADASQGLTTGPRRQFKLPGVYSAQPNTIQRSKSGGTS